MLSTNSSTNLIPTIFGQHKNRINNPIHSSVVLFPPKSLLFECLALVIRDGKILKNFPSHFNEALVASDIRRIAFTGGPMGGLQIVILLNT